MRPSGIVVTLGIAFALPFPGLSGEGIQPKTPPADYLEKVNVTPDYMQSDPALGSLGDVACGPTSASNSLMYLATRGYPRLRPPARNDHAAQTAMIRLLASPVLMKTNVKGTGPESILAGVRGYVMRAGYSGRLEYQGWRPISDRGIQSL